MLEYWLEYDINIAGMSLGILLTPVSVESDILAQFRQRWPILTTS